MITMGDRRAWSDEETEALLIALEEVVAENQRADAGQFKSGTYTLVLSKIKARFPDTNLQVNHIRNKIKKIKEKYSACADMLSMSGFGWNEVKMCVEVDSKSVLEEWLKKNPNSAYTCGKPYPLYPRLQGIFGIDRANGVAAEAPAEANENMDWIDEDHIDVVGENRSSQARNRSASRDANADGSSIPSAAENVSTAAASASCSKSRKRPRESETELFGELVHCMVRSMENQSEDGEKIAAAISGVDKSMKLGEEMRSLGFNVIDSVEIMLRMAEKPEYVSLFWGMDAEQRLQFANRLLAM